MFTTIAQSMGQSAKYTGGGLTYDPTAYQQGMANSDPYAYTTGWSGLESLGAGAGINGVIGDPNNPSGFNASRQLQPGDTRNGYEVNTIGLNPDGTLKYDPNSWAFQEYKPDGGWLRPAATWAALATGVNALGAGLAGAGAAGGAAAGNGAFLGEGAASGVPAWDAGAGLGGMGGSGIPAYTQAAGYGQQYGGMLADASGASPYTAAAGGDGAFLGGYGDLAAGGGVDNVGAYLTSGAAEGSTIGNALTGAGGAAGAVGAGTTAGTIGGIGSAVGGLSKLAGGSGGLLNLGGNLLNSYLGYNASQNAAEAQQRSAAEANALAKYMYDTTRADNMPALQARNTGLTGYQNLLQNPGQITQDPGYQFGFQQGQAGYDNSGAARGMRLSGAQAKALTRFGNDYGQTKYNESLNRYGNLAGLGQTGTSTIAQSGQNYANTAGQNITGAGNAAASGYIGGANAITGGISNFLKGWNEQNLLKQLGIGG